MNGQPKISIIVPVYGVEKYIGQCARNIFGQTYENLEIIFVNDCTPDRSMDILRDIMEEYPRRKKQCKIIDLPQNKGLGNARAVGLQNASGKYVLQIDSDDYPDICMVEKMANLAEQEKADITVCDYYEAYPSSIIKKVVNYQTNPNDCMIGVLNSTLLSYVWNKLIRRDLYTDNGITPEAGIDMREDMHVMYRLMYFAKKIAYLPEPLYYYRRNIPGSYTHKRMSPTAQRSAEVLIEHMDAFFKEQNITKASTLQAAAHLKAYLKAEIILCGDISRMNKCGLYDNVPLSDIMSHPTGSRILKIASWCYYHHLRVLTTIIRAIRKTIKEFKQTT